MKFLRFGLLMLIPSVAQSQAPCPVRHLAIFEGSLAEVLEERTLELQAGTNQVDWRSLMPGAVMSTLRVTGENVAVIRQEITFDGPEVRNQKSAVLHLTLRNTGAAGARKIQVDYLAPKLSWKNDYTMVLGAGAGSAGPTEISMDAWVSLRNDTGADVCGEAVDLVVGEVQLLEANPAPTFTANSQMAMGAMTARTAESAEAVVAGLSVFTRIALGKNIAVPGSTAIGRFPLFQRLKLAVEQRNIFENDARTETIGRGGFMTAPRGLEVRLVSRNDSSNVMPAGTVTIYAQDGGLAQVVGQDRMPITPVGGDFSVTQGRSNVMQGTRRVMERREVPEPTPPGGRQRNKLVTTVEVVIYNRQAFAAKAFVRDGIEQFGGGEWNVTESSLPNQKLGERMLEFPVTVPAQGSVKVRYTVEIR